MAEFFHSLVVARLDGTASDALVAVSSCDEATMVEVCVAEPCHSICTRATFDFGSSLPSIFFHSPIHKFSELVLTAFLSLVSRRQRYGGNEICQLRRETRRAQIVICIVVVLPYLHSQRVIHCRQNRWHSIQITFALSTIPTSIRIGFLVIWTTDFALECEVNQFNPKNGVLCFWMILHQLVAHRPPFARHEKQSALVRL